MITHSEQAESVLIGSLLVDPAVIDDVRALIKPDDIVSDDIRLMFAGCCALAERGTLDAISLADALERKTGRDWFLTVAEHARNAMSAHEAITSAKLIAEYALLRGLVSKHAGMGQVIANPDMELSAKIDTLQDMLSGIDAAEEEKNLKAQLRDVLDHMVHCSESGDGVTGIKTGFIDYDNQLRGLHPGELIVVGARPGMGKTNFALNILDRVTKDGGRVIMFSLEMAARELLVRLAACSYRIEYSRLLSARFDKAEKDAFDEFILETKDRKLVIDDNASLSIGDIRSRAKRARRKFGGLDLIIVDYLQLVRGEGENLRVQIENISRGLKILAKEAECPVIALSQLSRRCEERPDKRPLLSDLRESGAIEQDADVVTFLFREEIYNPETVNSGLAEIITRKLRHGVAGTVFLESAFNMCLFANTHRTAQENPTKQNGRGMQ